MRARKPWFYRPSRSKVFRAHLSLVPFISPVSQRFANSGSSYVFHGTVYSVVNFWGRMEWHLLRVSTHSAWASATIRPKRDEFETITVDASNQRFLRLSGRASYRGKLDVRISPFFRVFDGLQRIELGSPLPRVRTFDAVITVYRRPLYVYTFRNHVVKWSHGYYGEFTMCTCVRNRILLYLFR